MGHGVLVPHNVEVEHKLEQKPAYLATNAVLVVQGLPLNQDIAELQGVRKCYSFTISVEYEWVEWEHFQLSVRETRQSR